VYVKIFQTGHRARKGLIKYKEASELAKGKIGNELCIFSEINDFHVHFLS